MSQRQRHTTSRRRHVKPTGRTNPPRQWRVVRAIVARRALGSTHCAPHTGPNIGIVAVGTRLDGARPHAVQWQLGSCTASSRRRTTATIGHVQTLAGPMRQTRHEPTNTAHRPNTSTSRTTVGLFRPYEQGQTKTETDRSTPKEAAAPEHASPQSEHAETSGTSSDQSTRRDASAGRGTSAGQDSAVSVSYTHLTLPTIYSV